MLCFGSHLLLCFLQGLQNCTLIGQRLAKLQVTCLDRLTLPVGRGKLAAMKEQGEQLLDGISNQTLRFFVELDAVRQATVLDSHGDEDQARRVNKRGGQDGKESCQHLSTIGMLSGPEALRMHSEVLL